MSARAVRIATLAVLGFAVIAPAAWARPAANYAIHYVDPNDALMALEVKLAGVRSNCDFHPVMARDAATAGFKAVIEIGCESDDTLAKVEAALKEIDVPPPTHKFHIAVLSASRKDGPMPELSASEAKALTDFKKVMTYRSFQVQAETVVQSDQGAQTQLNMEYVLDFIVGPGNTGDSISVRRFQLRGITPQVAPTGAQSMPNYIETSFGIKPGETVVLGASTSDQQARVVLVTALQ